MYIYIHIYMCIYICTCMYVFIYACLCACVHTYWYVNVHVQAHPHAHTHTHLYISTYTTTRTKQNTHTHANTHNHSGVGNTKTITIAVRIIATFRNFLTSSTSLLVNLTNANPYGSSGWSFFSGKRPKRQETSYFANLRTICRILLPDAFSNLKSPPRSLVVVTSTQVIHLHLTLLYILTLKIRSKLARKNKMPSSMFLSVTHRIVLVMCILGLEKHVFVAVFYSIQQQGCGRFGASASAGLI